MTEDAALLAAISAVHDQLDPVPEELRDAARAAFALRDPDAALAELVSDGLLGATGMRGGGPRLLLFRAGAVSVELEVHEVGARRRVLGQLTPAGPGRLTVATRVESHYVAIDALGRFLLDDLPAGVCRLRWSPDAGDPVVTAWTTL
jgi:hypothetical protein